MMVQLARNNFSTLQGLNAQPGVTVTLRVDTGPPPARLQHIAERAAQAGDLRFFCLFIRPTCSTRNTQHTEPKTPSA